MKNKKIIFLSISLVLLVAGIVAFPNSFSSYREEIEDDKSAVADSIILSEQEVTEDISDGEQVLAYREAYHNEDVVGILQIPNTDFVVPVLQSNDNEYYLNHLPDKTRSSLGSVFLDYRNRVDDRKTILYGHNSETVETEFHLLENYVDPNYYTEHNIILFQTEEHLYRYQIFSVYIATEDYQHVNLNFTEEAYARHLAWLKEQSLYNTLVGVSPYDEVIVLQTCYFDPVGSYLIVVGKKV